MLCKIQLKFKLITISSKTKKKMLINIYKRAKHKLGIFNNFAI